MMNFIKIEQSPQPSFANMAAAPPPVSVQIRHEDVLSGNRDPVLLESHDVP
jgi:hypothetical protein